METRDCFLAPCQHISHNSTFQKSTQLSELLQPATMSALLKSVKQLEVSGDGRTAENWTTYKKQFENSLALLEHEGIYLKDLLLNHRSGVALENPGTDSAEWIAAGTGRDDEAYKAALKAWINWERANEATHSYIMATLPPVLHEECASARVLLTCGPTSTSVLQIRT